MASPLTRYAIPCRATQLTAKMEMRRKAAFYSACNAIPRRATQLTAKMEIRHKVHGSTGAMKFEDAASAFRARFPDGGLSRCDFRPHFDGYVVNAYSAMLPVRDVASTWEAALVLLAEISAWLQAHAGAFGAGDRIQLVVGFPESVKRDTRQIFKCWLPASRLAALRGVDFAAVGGGFHDMEVWPVGVAWPSVGRRP
jgi:hypothetical protein